MATSLRASATAIEIVAATTPPATLSEAAATSARIRELSVAVSVTRSASTVAVVAPSTNAATSVRMRLSALEPAPVNPPAAVPPAIATDSARTNASILASLVAVSVRSPPMSIVEASTKARTWAGRSTSPPGLGVQPMRLRATEAPIDAATATVPPETAAEAPATIARIDEWSVAVSTRSPRSPALVVVTLLPCTKALTRVRMTFVDSAPAPLTATAATPAPAAASDAATASASIAAVLVARSVTAPVRAVRPDVTPLTNAATSSSISLRASETPIDTDTPATPANAAASEAPSASALIFDASVAVSVTRAATTPWIANVGSPSPEIDAVTSLMIVFVADAPAPLAPTPATPAAATAADAAMTSALMRWSAVAVSVSAPLASIAERNTYARTSAGRREPSSARAPIAFSAIATPIDTPRPAVPPTPIAADAPTIVATIDAVALASSVTAPALETALSSIDAFVLPSTVLRAKAPAPASAAPTSPTPAASDAATETASIVGLETSKRSPTFVMRNVSVPETSCQTLPGVTTVSAGGT